MGEMVPSTVGFEGLVGPARGFLHPPSSSVEGRRVYEGGSSEPSRVVVGSRAVELGSRALGLELALSVLLVLGTGCPFS